MYTVVNTDALLNATEVFSRTITDPKAQVVLTLQGLTGLVLTPVLLMFYDGPDPGDNFAMFDGIIPVTSGTFKQPFADFVAAQATQLIPNNRGTSHTFSFSAVTLPLLEAVNAEVVVGRFVSASFSCLANMETEPYGQDDLTQWVACKRRC